MKEKKKLLNEEITAKTVQLIDEEKGSLGEMPIEEARMKAQELGLDLMEIGKNKNVSLVKILDYGKYLYRQKKQEQKQKQKSKNPELKTLRISFKIGEHDLAIRKKQAEKFAKGGHPLKITLMLRGRENHYEDLAREKITTFVEALNSIYKLEGEIKKAGNIFIAMMKSK